MRDVTISDLESARRNGRTRRRGLPDGRGRLPFVLRSNGRLVWAYLSRATAGIAWPTICCKKPTTGSCGAGGHIRQRTHRRNYLFLIASIWSTIITGGCGSIVCRAQRRGIISALRRTRKPSRERTARIDLRRAMARLKPRERDLLWLAYALGSSHARSRTALGLKTGSIKLLLFRARRRLVSLLGHAYAPIPDERASCEDE